MSDEPSASPTPLPSPAPTGDRVTIAFALTVSGVACNDYGTEEEAVVNAALAGYVVGAEASNFGPHSCASGSARRTSAAAVSRVRA